jgi:glycogen operon protein
VPGLDSAGSVPVGLVVDEYFDGGADAFPRTPIADSIVYEVHVKGFTMQHPDVPARLRGTYAGLPHPAALQHLVDLGVTAVELLPVHHSVTEPSVHAHALVNYWGYNTLGFFAPNAAYSAAGLEVILDVVFNHTAEAGGVRGRDRCGNSLDADSVIVLRLIMDSLRYWVEQMHVDGFRFDLTATLGRESGVFERTASFFDIIAQDPVLSLVKLIAEPWDVGQADSYDIGRFPAMWSEWNGAYRDTVRDFWRGTPAQLPSFATRVTGSSDLYGGWLRRPTASVNFITAHDGFTLRDLVPYDAKHNEANLENNADGTSDNRSWNCGAEGPTDDPGVLALRSRMQRALLTTLLTSFGVPMMLGGDEMGRTQRGNDNAYCQDTPLAWFDWEAPDTELVAFTRRLIRLRREHPVLRRRRFLTGADTGQVSWFTPAGTPMTSANWDDPNARAIMIHLDGHDAPDPAPDGSPLLDDDLLICVNAWREPLTMAIPASLPATRWACLIDSGDVTSGETATPPAPGEPLSAGGSVNVAAHSVMVLRGSRDFPAE